MCKLLKISRATAYYKSTETDSTDDELEALVIKIFKQSRNNYGSRKIKKELSDLGYVVSRRSLLRIMKKHSLVSSYTVKQFKVHRSSCNEDNVQNIVKQDFQNRNHLEVVVSDLTYVNVNGKWHYICLLIDLFNREILGYSSGKYKNISLVMKAFSKVKMPLNTISIFHTDRGNEFKNRAIDSLLNTFNIDRSLSKKGCPYDNAVAEATFKIFKTEFIFNTKFDSLVHLELELFDYVNWYNNHRIHGSLGYLTPVEYKALAFDKKLS